MTRFANVPGTLIIFYPQSVTPWTKIELQNINNSDAILRKYVNDLPDDCVFRLVNEQGEALRHMRFDMYKIFQGISE